MKKLFNRYLIIIVVLLSTINLTACKKLIEVDLPIDKYTGEQVYDNTTTAVAALNGIYTNFSGGYNFGVSFSGNNSFSLSLGVMADELKNGNFDMYQNNLSGAYGYSADLWIAAYRTVVFRTNSIIEGVQVSKGIPDGTKQVLIGEAKFIRALTYFYLVNLYGEVPLVNTTDFKINSNIPRSSELSVYDQIISDLIDAQNKLNDNYLNIDLTTTTNERVRPNKSAATALLARVYLYRKQWDKAEQEATKVISKTSLYDLLELNKVFLKNSQEAIWQLQPTRSFEGTNTADAKFFLPPTGQPPSDGYELSSFLLSAFELNDQRKIDWTIAISDASNNIYIEPYKYKQGRGKSEQLEYVMVLRLGEQYLIRAEARAEQGNISGAKEDLSVIRKRAGLNPIEATGKPDVLLAIEKERYVELFLENGLRWLDLKRTQKLNNRMLVVSPSKGGTWASYKQLFPIPYSEFTNNPALRGHQNTGYPEQL